jgi:hypothetical protein
MHRILLSCAFVRASVTEMCMAGGQQVIQAWVLGTYCGNEVRTAFRATQATGLTAKGSQGRRGVGTAHWTATDHINQLLATTVADPILRGEAIVRRYRGLELVERVQERVTPNPDGGYTIQHIGRPYDPQQPAFEPQLIGRNLGEGLDRLLTGVADGRADSDHIEHMRLIFSVGDAHPLHAIVEFRFPNGYTASDHYRESQLVGIGPDQDRLAATPERLAVVKAPTIRLMAKLLRDSWAQVGAPNSPSFPSGGAPLAASENAGPFGEGSAPSVRSRHKGVATPSHGPGSFDNAESMPRACACAMPDLASGPLECARTIAAWTPLPLPLQHLRPEKRRTDPGRNR